MSDPKGASARGVLSHLKVVDITHYIAGPYCTKLLAGFGAEVIKIEKPQTGDGMRSRGPFVKNQAGLENSIPFHWLNGGKQSITLNLKSTKGKEILKQLIGKADVVVENFAPRVMPSLGLDYDKIKEVNPAIVMTSISNFGQTGPYRDYRATEIVMYAMSGGMASTGDRERPPLAAGPAIAQYTAGMHGYIGTLMALFRRSASGEGEYVDVSIQESALENIEIQLAHYLHRGIVAHRKNDRHLFVPWECYPAQDGYAAIVGGPFRHWPKATAMFAEAEPGLQAEKYYHVIGRDRDRQEFEELLKSWCRGQKKKDIYHQGQSYGLAFGYLASLAEALQWSQHEGRNFFPKTESHPVVGDLKTCGPPFRLSGSSWHVGRAPLLGEHNEQIYGRSLGYGSAEIEQLKQEEII